MESKDWGYYVSLVGIAILVIWATLKSIGVIHSPTYQEMVPIFGFAVTFGGVVATVRNIGKDLDSFKTETRENFKEVRFEAKEIGEGVHHLDKEIEIIKSKV
jgi:hypothetical protein